MKAKFATEAGGYVTLSYDGDYDGATRVERTFICPVGGGYVREYRNGEWKQVCDRLSHMGSTLYCPSRDKLLTMIRGEYQSMRRAEKHEAGRYRL